VIGKFIRRTNSFAAPAREAAKRASHSLAFSILTSRGNSAVRAPRAPKSVLPTISMKISISHDNTYLFRLTHEAKFNLLKTGLVKHSCLIMALKPYQLLVKVMLLCRIL
jgi:hypothetical protein